MTGKALFSNLTTKSDYIVTINKKESHLEQIQAREGVNGNINKKGLGGCLGVATEWIKFPAWSVWLVGVGGYQLSYARQINVLEGTKWLISDESRHTNEKLCVERWEPSATCLEAASG